MSTPQWEFSEPCGWQLVVPVMAMFATGPVQISTEYAGVWVYNAKVHYDDGRPSTKRFRTTEEAKAFALSTYILEEP